MSDLAARIESIQARIAAAAERAGRKPAEINFIAVTKTVPIDQIQAAYDLGLRQFGESKLQEALPKIEALPKDVLWHFIGKLQSNKAKKAAENFRVIHTIESQKQIDEIEKGGYSIDGLIEVNIAAEYQKSGILLEDLDALYQSVLRSKRIRFRGLMTIGPAHLSGEDMRPYFERLRKACPEVPSGRWLSMGMSGDFEAAIQEGSTHVRIGSAIFGSRH